MKLAPPNYIIQNREIRFEVTNRCNATCIMCPREKMSREQGILDMDLYIRVLDEAYDMGARVVSLENFGETFIDPFFFERAAYAKGKGMKVFTISTGSLLNRSKANKCCNFLDKIRFSFYGTTKEVYEKIHVGLDFDVSVENIRYLISEKKKRSSPIPKIEVYFLLMEENKHQVEDFKEMWLGKADDVSIWKPHNWSDGRQYRLLNIDQPKITCGRPRLGPIQVQWNGLLVPCCYDYNSAIVLGDLYKQSLYEAITGEEYNHFRKAHDDKAFYLYPFCDSCDQLQKRNDVLVFSTIQEAKVGTVNTTFDRLD